MATKKLTYQDFRAAADKVTESIGLGKSHHYAYVVGAYEIMLADMAAALPKAQQEDVMRSLKSLAVRVAELG
jgi:hypothetical protein